ncbi:MAG: spondin domain-containing protein [Pseudomonadota bacterium]
MTDLRVTIDNTSPVGGTFLTPVWFGFHDGSFDLFDGGQAASAGLEQIAEDGAAAGLATELVAADSDGEGFVITGAGGPIATQETTSQVLSVNGLSNPLVSLAAMLLPSNDAFIGTGEAVRLFDDAGNFLGAQTLVFAGENVYDAGTEFNTEMDAAFINQTGPDTGLDENSVVRLHEGFNGSAGNPDGSLGNPDGMPGEQIILGGTNDFMAFIDPVAADFTLPGAQIASVHINTVEIRTGTDAGERIFGSAADDLVEAGGGNDKVFARAGFDEVMAGSGDDRAFLGHGNDRAYGQDGSDKLFGDGGDDFLDGGDHKDALFGGTGNDELYGGAGNDHLFGQSGNDRLDGGEGNDRIFAQNGDDYAMGGAGNDKIFGAQGDDHLAGGLGNDDVFGGVGDDSFYFAAGDGHDRLFNFGRGEDELILQIDGIDSAEDLFATATQLARGTEFDFGDDGSVLLFGARLNQLDGDDFSFV